MFDALASQFSFLTKSVTLEILFSTSIIFVSRTLVVTKFLTTEILFSTLPNFVLRTGVVAKALVSGILSSISLVYFSKFCLSVLY